VGFAFGGGGLDGATGVDPRGVVMAGATGVDPRGVVMAGAAGATLREVSSERSSGKSIPEWNCWPSIEACAFSVSCPRSLSSAPIGYGPQTRPCSVLIQYCLPSGGILRI